jgi:hypothetical protein
MWLLSIYRPTVSNRTVTLSEAPRANPEDVLKQAHEKGKGSSLLRNLSNVLGTATFVRILP